MSSKASKTTRIDRELAHLKILSRLLGHEMHSQSGQRILLSRDAVEEIQTSIDLFIEAAGGVVAKQQAPDLASVETTPVGSRRN